MTTSNHSHKIAWRASLADGLVIGAILGSLIVWHDATQTESLVVLWIVTAPIAVGVFLLFAAVVRLILASKKRSEARAPRSTSIAWATGTATLFVVAFAGRWAVAESGLSHHLLSDGALRRLFMKHQSDLRHFESEWRAATTEGEARSAADRTYARIGCVDPPVWDSIGGPICFPCATEQVLKAISVKGIVLVPQASTLHHRRCRGEWSL